MIQGLAELKSADERKPKSEGVESRHARKPDLELKGYGFLSRRCAFASRVRLFARRQPDLVIISPKAATCLSPYPFNHLAAVGKLAKFLEV